MSSSIVTVRCIIVFWFSLLLQTQPVTATDRRALSENTQICTTDDGLVIVSHDKFNTGIYVKGGDGEAYKDDRELKGPQAKSDDLSECAWANFSNAMGQCCGDCCQELAYQSYVCVLMICGTIVLVAIGVAGLCICCFAKEDEETAPAVVYMMYADPPPQYAGTDHAGGGYQHSGVGGSGQHGVAPPR